MLIRALYIWLKHTDSLEKAIRFVIRPKEICRKAMDPLGFVPLKIVINKISKLYYDIEININIMHTRPFAIKSSEGHR